LYIILSVPATASQTEIKAAYRKLVHDLHPDKHAHKQGQVGGLVVITSWWSCDSHGNNLLTCVLG
jgi:hypothetical protein